MSDAPDPTTEAALQETRETTDLADFDAPALRRLTLAMTGRRLPGVPQTHHRKEH